MSIPDSSRLWRKYDDRNAGEHSSSLRTPKEIDELINGKVKKLGSKDGGLILIAGVSPPTPTENVEAL